MEVSFAATGAVMAGAFLVVLFAKWGDPENPVLSLELAITFMATVSYVFFVSIFNGCTSFEPGDIPKLRYVEWAVTTPLMLFALCLILAGNNRISAPFFFNVVALDWLMLLIGYLGEVGHLERKTACLLGFIPFFALFFYIYQAFRQLNVLFVAYVLIWSMYGVFYLLDDRLFAINVLDSVAKAGVAVAYCVR